MAYDPYQDPPLPVNPTQEDLLDFQTPVSEMPGGMSDSMPIPQKPSKGMSFDFNGLVQQLQKNGFNSLSEAQKNLLWDMKEGVQYSPEQMAMYVQNFNNKKLEQSTPKAQVDLQKSQIDLQKSQSEVAQMESRKQAASSEIAGMRQMLADLKNHPGMSTSIGAKGIEYNFGWSKEPYSGTKAADFYSLLEQVQGGTFMQAFNNLKGGGQITEQEGAKATAAIARLNPRQSEEGFNKALMDFDGVLAQAQARSQANSPQQTSAPQAAATAAPQPMPQTHAAPATRVIGGRTFIQQPNGNWIPR